MAFYQQDSENQFQEFRERKMDYEYQNIPKQIQVPDQNRSVLGRCKFEAENNVDSMDMDDKGQRKFPSDDDTSTFWADIQDDGTFSASMTDESRSRIYSDSVKKKRLTGAEVITETGSNWNLNDEAIMDMITKRTKARMKQRCYVCRFPGHHAYQCPSNEGRQKVLKFNLSRPSRKDNVA